MTKTHLLKRMLGVATLAMLFGTPAIHAQSDSPSGGGNQGGASQGMETKSSDTDLSDTSDSMKSGSSGASSGASSDASSGAAGGSSGAASGAESKTISKSDQRLMYDLAQSNMAEIAASELAKEKSKDDQVQSFAQKMIDDHTEAQDKLQQLAQQKGVTLPTKPDRQYQAEMKKMQGMSGDKFDKYYLSEVGREDHRDANKMLTKIEKQAKDPDLKQLATDMKKTIGEHLRMAQQLRSADAATKASGSSGDAGSSGSGGSAAVTGRPGGNTVDLTNQPGTDSSGGATSGSSNSTGSGK